MHYPKLSTSTEYRLELPLPDKGICRSKEATAIADRQCADADNIWWNHGLLCSRPVLSPVHTCSLSEVCPEGNTPDSLRLCHEQTNLMGDGSRHLLLESFSPEQEFSLGLISIDREGEVDSLHPLWNELTYPQEQIVYIEAGGDMDQPMLLQEGTLFKARGMSSSLPPYVPLLALRAQGDTLNTPAPVGGVPLESRNLLTDAFRVEYAITEEGIYFHLPSESMSDGTLQITCTDREGHMRMHSLTVSTTGVAQEGGCAADGLQLFYSAATHNFWFCNENNVPQSPYAVLCSTLMVRFQPTEDTAPDRDRIQGMQFGTWFGGDRSGLTGGTRLFLSGHLRYPHLVHYSALNNPAYFPENSYFYVGSAADPITAFGKQGRMLVIFKHHEIGYVDYSATPLSASVASEGGVVDAETQSAVFPLTPLHVGVGCDCPQSLALCEDRLVWCTTEGKVYTLISGNAYSQCNVRSIGTSITPLLQECSREDLQNATGLFADDHYILLVGEQVFVCRMGDDTGHEPAWYRWHFPCRFIGGVSLGDTWYLLSRLTENDTDMLITYTLSEGDADRILTVKDGALTDCVLPVESYFETKLLDFGRPERYKNVRLLSLSGRGNGMQQLGIRCRDDRGDEREEIKICCAENTPALLFPSCRHIRYFGCRIGASKAVRYDGLSLLYNTYFR